MALPLSKAESKELSAKLVRLNDAVNSKKLDVIKLVAKHAFGVGQEDLDKADLLTSVYTLLEEKHGNSALSILIMILEGLDVQGPLVDSLKEHKQTEPIVQVPDLRMMDFILTVSCILSCLGKNKYLSLKEMARRTFFSHYDPSTITSRTHLLQLLLESNSLTPDSFDNLFAWLEVVGCSLYHNNLREYCLRNQIEVPEWENLVSPLKDKYPDACESDFEIHPTSESLSIATAPIRGDGGLIGSQSLSKSKLGAVPFTNSGGGKFDYTSSPTASYHHSAHHPVNSGPTAMVAATNSAPNTNAVIVHGHQEKASGDGIETSSQFHMEPDGSDHETNDESGINRTELRHPESESSPEGCEEGKLHVDSRSSSQLPEGSPMNNVAVPDSPINADSPPIPTIEIDIGKKVVKIKEWVCLHKCPICLLLLFFFLLLCIGGTTSGLTYKYIGSNPGNKTVLLAENATVNIGCFNLLHIGHFLISAVAQTSFKFFAVPSSQLVATKTTLPFVSNKRAGTGHYISLNYYHIARKYPLYTAGSGTLSYSINFTDFDCQESDTNSYFHSYLFNSLDLFNKVLNILEPASGFIDKIAFCPNSTNKIFNFTFQLPSDGFYYVAAFLPSNMNIDARISAEVPTYNITYLEALPSHQLLNGGKCLLDDGKCLLQVGHHPVHTHSESVCILASSSSDLYGGTINGTVSPQRYIFNARSVSTFFLGSGFFVIIFIALCAYIFYKTRASRRSNYQRLDSDQNADQADQHTDEADQHVDQADQHANQHADQHA